MVQWELSIVCACAFASCADVVSGLVVHSGAADGMDDAPLSWLGSTQPLSWAEETISGVMEVEVKKTSPATSHRRRHMKDVTSDGTMKRVSFYSSCKPTFKDSALRTVFSLNGTMMPHIFKDAGTALMTTVRENGGEVYSMFTGHHTPQEVSNHFATHDGVKAALVRDPLKRAISAFHEVMSRKHCEEDPETIAEAGNQETMMELFADKVINSTDLHFQPQMQFLVDSNGHTFELDYIGSTDNLQQEVASLFGLPVDISIPRESGPECGRKFEDYFRIDISKLPPNVMRDACKRYAVDYCCLGFAFPDACGAMSCDHIFA